jgi:RNA polymerase sigma-B factor
MRLDDARPTPTAALVRRARHARPGCSNTDDRALFIRYHECRDPELRDALVERYLPLVRAIARRHRNPAESFDDILQVACLSLLKAIDRFDPTFGVAFSSYAVPSIIGEIKRHYRDHTWAIRVPRDLKELALRIERVSRELGNDLQRAPTAAEVGARLGISVEEVLAGRTAAVAYRPDSLHAPRGGGDGQQTLGQSIGHSDPGFARAEDREALRDLMDALTARERLILTLRFDRDLTQSEIAERMGLSQMTVSRALRQILGRLQDMAAREDGLAFAGPGSD